MQPLGADTTMLDMTAGAAEMLRLTAGAARCQPEGAAASMQHVMKSWHTSDGAQHMHLQTVMTVEVQT